MSHITRRREAKEVREHFEHLDCYPWESGREDAAVPKPTKKKKRQTQKELKREIAALEDKLRLLKKRFTGGLNV